MRGIPRLADHNNHVQIEKLILLEDELDASLRKAFSNHEAQDLQCGLAWLSNMALYALDEHELAVIFIARRSPDDFLACPMKLSSHNRSAHSLSTFYTSRYLPVVCSDRPEMLFCALFRHLARIEKISELTLNPMDFSSPIFGLIQDALAETGWKGIHRFYCFGNWTHDIGGVSYQDYLASRPSQLRNTVVRRTRQFLAADRGQLKIVRDGDALESAIEQFVAIYNCSWKRKEPYPEFIPHLLRLSASRGWLRLGIASYDNKPIASQIWLVWGGTAYIFKLAYHEDYKQLSPGTVLTGFMMEQIVDNDRVTRIDYLSGDDDYKKSWMSGRGERQGIAAYNPATLRGMSMHIGRTLNNVVKSIRGKATTTRSSRIDM